VASAGPEGIPDVLEGYFLMLFVRTVPNILHDCTLIFI